MPSDYREGVVETGLPDGRKLRLRIGKEDAEHARKLAAMDGVTILERPEEIYEVFEECYGKR